MKLRVHLNRTTHSTTQQEQQVLTTEQISHQTTSPRQLCEQFTQREAGGRSHDETKFLILLSNNDVPLAETNSWAERAANVL